MSFFGKKWKKVKLENVNELLEKINAEPKIRQLFTDMSLLVGYEKNSDGSIQYNIIKDGAVVHASKYELNVEKDTKTPDGKDAKETVTLDGDTLTNVLKFTDGGEVIFKRVFSGNTATMVENTKLVSASEDGQTELEVEILEAPKPEQDVRPIGYDIPMGAVLVEKGSILDAAHVGVLAGAGYQNVTVRANPKVALMSTGNELQEPSDLKLKPAHIRDSNRAMLKSLLREHGYRSIDCGIARDEPAQLVTAITQALTQADILICTGGVSMGEKDLLKPVLLKDFGATLHFGRVRMKPGKPSTFATCQIGGRTKYIFALPGNPVSAYVCCLLFVIRALRVATGRRANWTRMRVKLAHGVHLDLRPEYARAVLKFPDTDDLPTATLLGNQCSSRLLSACGASVLLELPPATHETQLPAGTIVPALITGDLAN